MTPCRGTARRGGGWGGSSARVQIHFLYHKYLLKISQLKILYLTFQNDECLKTTKPLLLLSCVLALSPTAFPTMFKPQIHNFIQGSFHLVARRYNFRERVGRRARKESRTNVNKSDENQTLTFKMRPCPWTESVRWISTLKARVSIFGEAALLLWRTSVSRCLLLDTPANNIFYSSISVKQKNKNEHELKPSLTQSGQKKKEQNVMD